MTMRSGPEIDHVEIAARDAAATTRLLVEAFSAVEQRPGRLLLGTTPLEVRPDGSGRALSAVGLRSDDLDGLRRRLSDAQVAFDDEDAPDAPGPAIRLRAQDWGGVPLVIGAWPPPDPPPASPDGNVLRMDHIGVASVDNSAAERRFCDLLGLDVESRQTDTETVLRVEQFTSDTHGVRVATSQVGQTGLRVLFVSLGDTDLELLQDLSASGGDGERSSSTAGDTTAIARYIDRFGPGLHHLALRVRDIDAALLRAKEAGAALIDETGRPGSRRAQIAFIDPRSTARILFHFVQR